MIRKRDVTHAWKWLCMVGIFVSLGFGPASKAVQRVREGIQLFSGGDFAAAGKAFTEADVVEPENPTIAFDRACALNASGESVRALELFQMAALAKDSGIASSSHYNIGCLSAEQGRATLGEDPIAAAPEQRQQGMTQLLAAVASYRDCLRIDPGHADARHNLELIRLFVKHIQDQWEKQDREKARREMNLLEFLEMVEQRQATMRSVVQSIKEDLDSPRRRQATSEAARDQTELREEIQTLQEKIVSEFQTAPAAQSGNAPPSAPTGDSSQAEQVRKLLVGLADEAGDRMMAAASRIDATEFDDADRNQRDVLDRLNQIFMVVAPFANVLRRATEQQEKLVGTSEAVVESEVSPEDADESATSPDNAETNVPELAWRQTHITDWSRMLGLKAEAELPTVESQLQNSQATAEQPQVTPPEDDPANPVASAADPSASLHAMKATLEKAIELAPKVVERSTEAAESLGQSNVAEALPDQREALKLLREIAESLDKENSQRDNQQDDDNQDQDQDQKQDQGQGGEDQGQDQSQGEDQNEESRSRQEQQAQQNQSPQQDSSPQERAMSVLRKARERERQHRDLQKRLQQISGGSVRVERDW